MDRTEVIALSRGVPGASKLPGAGRLFANRGIGSNSSAGGASVGVTIIDPAEWDRTVLNDGRVV